MAANPNEIPDLDDLRARAAGDIPPVPPMPGWFAERWGGRLSASGYDRLMNEVYADCLAFNWEIANETLERQAALDAESERVAADVRRQAADLRHQFRVVEANAERDILFGGARPATRMTAPELMAREFAPLQWAVPGLIPEGLSILVGRPKLGKSRLLLNVAVAVAHGGRALGRIEVDRGGVLLLALEDGPRRLQDRLRQALEGEAPPENLEVDTAWPRSDQGGDVLLDQYLSDHPDVKLVIIDTLARVRPARPRGADIYQTDYEAIACWQSVAQRHPGVGIVIVTHSNKGTHDDPLYETSGSTGLTGAADNMLIMRRAVDGKGATLYCRGRDIEEVDYALASDPDTGTWLIQGSAAEFEVSETRRLIMQLLEEVGADGMTPQEIADESGLQSANVRKMLRRMVKDGQASQPKRGVYAVDGGNNANRGHNGHNGHNGHISHNGHNGGGGAWAGAVRGESLPAERAATVAGGDAVVTEGAVVTDVTDVTAVPANDRLFTAGPECPRCGAAVDREGPCADCLDERFGR